MKSFLIFCLMLELLSINVLSIKLIEINQETVNLHAGDNAIEQNQIFTSTGIEFPMELVNPNQSFVCPGALGTQYPQLNLIEIINADWVLRISDLVFKVDDFDVKIPLSEADSLLSNKHFKKNLPLTIFVADYKYSNNSMPIVNEVYEAYKCRGGYNFVALEILVYPHTDKTWATTKKRKTIGEALGEGLAKIVKSYPIDKIHVIGMGVGAHIAGAAAKYVTSTTKKRLPRITGLQPDVECRNPTDMLDANDAEFVDIIYPSSIEWLRQSVFPSPNVPWDTMGNVTFYVATSDGVGVKNECEHCTKYPEPWAYYAGTVYPGYEESLSAIELNASDYNEYVEAASAMDWSFIDDNKRLVGYAASCDLNGKYYFHYNCMGVFGQFVTKKRQYKLENKFVPVCKKGIANNKIS